MTALVPWLEGNSDSAFFFFFLFLCLEEDILLRQQWWRIRYVVLKKWVRGIDEREVRYISVLIIHTSECSHSPSHPVFPTSLSLSLYPPDFLSTARHLICWCLFLLASSHNYILLLFISPWLYLHPSHLLVPDSFCLSLSCSLSAGEIDGYKPSSQRKMIGSKQ